MDVLVLIILIVGVYLYAGWLGYKETAMIVEVQDVNPQLNDPYTLTPNQEEQLITYGYPEGFTILFYEEERIES